MKEGEHMAYWVAIVDDSTKDAEFVQGILNTPAKPISQIPSAIHIQFSFVGITMRELGSFI